MLRLAALVPALIVVVPAMAAAAGEEPAVLTQPLPAAPVAAPAEETPGFQAVRPLAGAPPAATADTATEVIPPPPPRPPIEPAEAETGGIAIGWGATLGLLGGGLIAGLAGLGSVLFSQRRAEERRLRAVAATLAIELESRRQAFETVPVPPSAEAGVSFVSAVSALARLDYGWRSVQDGLYLLPDKLAGHLAVHYGAVSHVAEFVKGQSVSAALRMLQANRIGGHPSPDAGALREAHVELTAAFRGIEKLIGALKSLG